MTNKVRILDLPEADETASAEAVVSQNGRGRRYTVGTATTKNIGTEAGEVPVLATGGVLPLELGGTGRDNSAAGNNKVFGTDSSGNPATHDLPGGTPSILDRSVTGMKVALATISEENLADACTGSDQIQNLAVLAKHIDDDALESRHYKAASVDTDALKAQAVTTEKYANRSVNQAAMGLDSVDYDIIDWFEEGELGQVPTIKHDAGGNKVLGFSNKGDATIPLDSIIRGMLKNAVINSDKVEAGSLLGTDLAENADIQPKQLKATGTRTAGQLYTLTGDGTTAAFMDPAPGAGLPGAGQITEPMFGDAVVSSRAMQNDSVAGAAIISNAVDLRHIRATGKAPLRLLGINAQNNALVCYDPAVIGGGGGGAGLNVGFANKGDVLMAQNNVAQAWIDPANPPTLADVEWGTPVDGVSRSTTAATGTGLGGVTGVWNATVYNLLNPSTDTIVGEANTGNIRVANKSYSAPVNLRPTGSDAVNAVVFARSSDNNYVMLVYGDATTSYFYRQGSLYNEISSAKGNTNLLSYDVATLPNDSRWHPIDSSVLPTGVEHALGRRSGTAFYLMMLTFNASGTTMALRSYTGTLTSKQVGFKPAPGSVGAAAFDTDSTIEVGHFVRIAANGRIALSSGTVPGANTITPSMMKVA